MKLDGWKLVVVLVALIALVGALGWRGILDAKSIGLALTTVLAWLIPSPLMATATKAASITPVVISEKKQ